MGKRRRQHVQRIAFQDFGAHCMHDALRRIRADHAGQWLVQYLVHGQASTLRPVFTGLAHDQIIGTERQQQAMRLDAARGLHRLIIAVGQGDAMALDTVRERQGTATH